MASMVLKCCMFAVLIGVLSILLRELCGAQWATFCAIAGAITLLIFGLSSLEDWIGQIRILIDKSGLDGKDWRVLLKSALVCLSVDFTADFCKNMGQPLLAHGLEIVGRVCLGILAVPYILEVLSMLEGILQA